jgi:type 1 fimbria pilin
MGYSAADASVRPDPKVGLRLTTSVAVLVLVSALPAAAQQDGGTVSARVTVADQLCLLIDEAALETGLDFGVLDFDGSATSSPYNLESCSTGSQELFGSGTDAANDPVDPSVTWSLVDGAGARSLDEFSVSAALDGGGAVWLPSDGVASVGTLDAAASAAATHQLLTPPAGSAGAGETLTFELTWTAALPD